MSFDGKRMASLRIYSVLKEYSDEKHLLTHNQIAHYLEKDYGIILGRKAISNYLYELEIGGFKIEITPKGTYLYERDFDDLEIRLLIDSVLSSKYIDKKSSKRIIDKLCSLSNKYFKLSLNNINALDTWNKSENQNLFLNIEIITEAISENKQVEFIYNRYEIDKKLHPVRENPYRVSPYQLVNVNGNYYLIAYVDKIGKILNFEIDKITKIGLTNNKRNIKEQIQLSEYVKTHPYMHNGTAQDFKLKVKASAINDVINFFGKDIQIGINDEKFLIISLKSDFDDVCMWALQHGNVAELVYPKEAREKVCNIIRKMNKSYLI